MFKKRLQWKLVIFICLIAVCLVIPIGIFLNISIENFHYNQFIENIEKGFDIYEIQEGSLNISNVYQDMRDIYAPSFGIYGNNKSYTIINRKNNEIFSSDSSFLSKDEQVFLTELYSSINFITAVSGEHINHKELITINNRAFYDYAVVKENLVFYFRYYKEDWQLMVSEFNNSIMTSLLISLVFAFIIGYLLSKSITKPINDIIEKTQDIAEGEFGQLLEKAGNDEIGQLTMSINEMSLNLKNMLEDIFNEKNKIDAILTNMTDGIIAFDVNGVITHVNPVSLKLLHRRKINETIQQIIKEYKINITFDEIIKKTDKVNNSNLIINIHDTILHVAFGILRDKNHHPEGIIMILRDITKQQKLDEMRKEFVANVSHELKTPLTSIKSYTETLLNGMVDDQETREQFLQVINSETDRMYRIVRDLLQLSAMDLNQLYLNRHLHSINELIIKTIEKVEVEAKAKNHMIYTEIEYEGNAFFDYDKIQQVLINVLTNAIKYSDEFGKITVKSIRNKEYAYISVKDTGIGIPEKDLPRIFERFYTVDKARSRKMGGTGLGLAIAKEIMIAHNGNIILDSKKKKGTTVTIIIPIEREKISEE
ncbi:MAG: HAMP domain-containing protein [Clostridiales bacterium]|nr:HAMP domain-containing protein [Clostridiales bacterium]